MFQKAILILTLLGLALGLFTGILDSLFHFIGFENFKVINIFIFLAFFTGATISVLMLRNNFLNGYITYWGALKNFIYVGTIASFTISAIRFVYLKYIAKIDLEAILNKTEKTMLDHYSQYKDELIDNRLSFIEFSYDPAVSSMMYFFYYMFMVVAFALIVSLFIKKIDRTISI